MYHVGVALCQAVIQVLLSMRSQRLANTPIQYRYIPDNSTISVLRFSIIRCIREIEMYVYSKISSKSHARYYEGYFADAEILAGHIERSARENCVINWIFRISKCDKRLHFAF